MTKYSKIGNAVVVEFNMPSNATESTVMNTMAEVMKRIKEYTDVRIIFDCREMNGSINDLGKYRIIKFAEQFKSSIVHCVIILSAEGQRRMSTSIMERYNQSDNFTVVRTTKPIMARKWIAQLKPVHQLIG